MGVIKDLSSCSLQGLLRLLILKIAGKDYLIVGSCIGCGSCCRKINLKTSKGWIRSEEHFKRMLKVHHDFQRFDIAGKDSQGFLQFSCSWLMSSGLCRDHKNRLDICRKYPAKSLMFCGGSISEECGYTIETVTPFKKILEMETQRLK